MGEVKDQVSISRLVEKQIILIVEAPRSTGFDKFTVSSSHQIYNSYLSQ